MLRDLCVWQALHTEVCHSLVPTQGCVFWNRGWKIQKLLIPHCPGVILPYLYHMNFFPGSVLAQAQKHANRHRAHTGETILKGGVWGISCMKVLPVLLSKYRRGSHSSCSSPSPSSVMCFFPFLKTLLFTPCPQTEGFFLRGVERRELVSYSSEHLPWYLSPSSSHLCPSTTGWL